MKSLRPIGIRSLFLKKNLVTMGIIITGILSILMTLLTYYGSYAGNFIVIIDSRERISSIVLSENSDFDDPAPRLFANSVNDSPPLAYYDIKVQDAVLQDGNYDDPDFQYFAYSFYLKNNGNQILNVEAKYLITDVIRNSDKAIRIIVVKNEDLDTMEVYQKEDTVEWNYPPNYPETKHFENTDEGLVFTENIEDFYPGQIIKYTVINYVEGYDPDCDDSIAGGLIKMTMRFSIMSHIDPDEIEEA